MFRMTHDKEQILKTLRLFFAAAERGDRDAFKACLTAEFFVHEGGERYDADGVFALIVNAQRNAKQLTWTVREPVLHIDGSLACVAYVNRGSITRNGTVECTDLLETATMARGSDGWRIAFMTSIRSSAGSGNHSP
jgi:ketosteroid isomerase-like protein